MCCKRQVIVAIPCAYLRWDVYEKSTCTARWSKTLGIAEFFYHVNILSKVIWVQITATSSLFHAAIYWLRKWFNWIAKQYYCTALRCIWCFNDSLTHGKKYSVVKSAFRDHKFKVPMKGLMPFDEVRFVKQANTKNNPNNNNKKIIFKWIL